MKIAIVYDSVTGNTKLLADTIYEVCEGFDVSIYKEYCDEILDADVIFVGSWTDKGEPSWKIKAVYDKLRDKKIFVFGTCGFGGSEEYYNRLFENTKKYINDSNEILDYYFCPGKLSMSIKEKYEKMLEDKPNDQRILNMIDNFNKVLDRPNADDLDKLKEKVGRVIHEG